MILRIFKGTGPGAILIIVITFLLLWLGAFLNPQLPPQFNYETLPMPLYGLLQVAVGNNAFVGVIISFLVVGLMSFLLVYFNTSVFFINERTFLPAVLFMLITGLFPQNQLLNPVLPASVFLLLALIRIMDGYRKPGVAYNFFDAAVLISSGSLFYAGLIWFGLLVLIGIALLRTGSLIEILISLVGLLTPYLITFGVYYISGKDLPGFIGLIKTNIFSVSADYEFSRITIVALIITGVIIVISTVQLFSVVNRKKIKSRKTFSLLLWTFLLSGILYFVLPSVSVEMTWLTAIPVSYFLAHYFVFIKKKLMPELMFILFILAVAVIQIMYLI